MTKNMGAGDRVTRLAIAIGIAILYVMGAISGTLAVVLGIVALAFAATGMLGWCPLYAPFRFATNRQARGAAG